MVFLLTRSFLNFLLARFLLEAKTERDPKTHKMDAIAGRHHEPVSRSGKLDGLIPSAAAEYFELAGRRAQRIGECCRWIRGEPIVAPLPHIAMHIV